MNVPSCAGGEKLKQICRLSSEAPEPRRTPSPSFWLPGAFGRFRESRLRAWPPSALEWTQTWLENFSGLLMLACWTGMTTGGFPLRNAAVSGVSEERDPRSGLTQARNIPQPRLASGKNKSCSRARFPCAEEPREPWLKLQEVWGRGLSPHTSVLLPATPADHGGGPVGSPVRPCCWWSGDRSQRDSSSYLATAPPTGCFRRS